MAGWTTRAVLFAAAFAVGCELLVPDSLPPYVCGAGNGSCPQGMTCDVPSSQCIYPADVVTMMDAMGGNDVSVDVVVIPDSPSETSVCRGLGCTCSGASDCDSEICADDETVTPALYSEVGHGFCIAPCCTSSDCPTGFVCFATDVGGDYCVDPSLLGRSTTLGTTTGGATCSTASECRSGVCATTCQDTCCSMYESGECSGTDTCRYGAFPGTGFDTHMTARCATAGGSLGNGDSCGSDASCKSDLCVGACADGCRNSSDCSPGFCSYAVDTDNDILTVCNTGGGSTPLGGACTTDANCATALCDPTSFECTDVCYTNNDCKAMSGWICRPETLQIQGGGFASVLLCGT